MKWIKTNHEGQEKYGVLEDQTIQLTTHTWEEVLSGKKHEPTSLISRDDVKLLNPIGRPGKIVCVGLNYMDHCRETNTPPPERPLLFTRFTTSMVGPNDEIVWRENLTDKVDFEAELGVVIGKTCRRVNPKDALDFIAGYTAANDVSARDIQLGDGQWVRGKSLDTFCPLGPIFVTCDEIPDPQTLRITLSVNGVTKQDSNTKNMIFNCAEIIEFISTYITLEPGDVISTGTPSGIGYTLGEKLQDGDLVEIEIEKIGTLRNPVCAAAS